MKNILFVAIGFWVLGCGKGDGFLDLRIQFPDSLKKGGARYQRFLSRAEYLEIKLKSDGKEYENRFPPMQWESLVVPEFPISEKGVDVHVGVWDRTKDGTKRNYPVLEAKKKISKEEAKSPTASLIKLSLKIAPENWD